MNEVRKDIGTVQETYTHVRRSRFRQVLTEMALLSFRNQGRGIDYTIPVIFYGEDDWEADLE